MELRAWILGLFSVRAWQNLVKNIHNFTNKTFHHKGHEVHNGIRKGEIHDLEIRRKINSKNFVTFVSFVVRKGFAVASLTD